MVKKTLLFLVTIVVAITIQLTLFELLLHIFHTTINSTANQEIISSVWNYLLKQRYITFIDLDIFTIHEKRHLLDVKRVLENSYNIWLWLFTTTIFLLFILKEKRGEVLNRSRVVTIIIAVSLILISLNFLDSFNSFHTLFFKNQSWIFDPNSTLIEIFPIEYFQQFFIIFIGLNILAILSQKR